VRLRHLAVVPVLGLAFSMPGYAQTYSGIPASVQRVEPAVIAAAADRTPSSWDIAVARTVHADVAASAALPGGRVLWAFGDTTQIDGTSTVSKDGYPHDSFVLQTGNVLRPLPGRYGFGWQQVPNWPDGDYFWANALLLQDNTLYVFGEKERTVSKKRNSFATVASAIATFNATTLRYEGVTVLPTARSWGEPVQATYRGAEGYWLIGTRAVKCSDASGCKVGDTAFIPAGDELRYRDWKITDRTIPRKDDIGTTVSLLRYRHGYVAFTKRGDVYGKDIETLTASTPTGPWTIGKPYRAPSPRGTQTYNVQVHPEQSAPAGRILLTYSVNGVEADYHPLFLDVDSDGG
jgi:hypothetical protein